VRSVAKLSCNLASRDLTVEEMWARLRRLRALRQSAADGRLSTVVLRWGPARLAPPGSERAGRIACASGEKERRGKVWGLGVVGGERGREGKGRKRKHIRGRGGGEWVSGWVRWVVRGGRG
jgi:hypothetical protein